MDLGLGLGLDLGLGLSLSLGLGLGLGLECSPPKTQAGGSTRMGRNARSLKVPSY